MLKHLSKDYTSNKNSNFNLSFLVNMGVSRWFSGDIKLNANTLGPDFKSQIPKDEPFEISSLIFNIPKHKKEILSEYKCYYDEKSNTLTLILSEDICFSEFTKEIMMNLFTFTQKVGIDTICFLVDKKNPQYTRILQDLMIVGFKSNEKKKEVTIDDRVYKVMDMQVNVDSEIEEFYF